MASHPKAKRRFGQNFLVDGTALGRVAEALPIGHDDLVLEIGPGTGLLTEQLLKLAGRVVAVEIDRDLVPRLQQTFGQNPRFQLVEGDFLKLETAPLLEGPYAHRWVVANIPYYITSPILMRLLNEPAVKQAPIAPDTIPFDGIVLMVQKEVADRLVAAPGNKDFGALSVVVQFAAQVERVARVPKGAFRPIPKVDSEIIRLFPRRQDPVPMADRPLFWQVVAAIYSGRRKTLRNSLLRAGLPRETIAGLTHDLDVRGETLSLAALAELIAHIKAVQAAH